MKFNTKYEGLLYTCIITATVMFMIKSLYTSGKKKQKNKRRAILKSKLFFGEVNKKVELRKVDSRHLIQDNQRSVNQDRMTQFIQRMTNEVNEGCAAPEAKKDKIFFCLVNNLLAKKN